MPKRYHVAFGVYGIIGDENGLVVIKKNGGPYINRYDLPGGSLADGESLFKAISREIYEETGLSTSRTEQVGTTSFKYPWAYEKWAFNQHICVFYRVHKSAGAIEPVAPQFIGQDSLGAAKIPLENLTIKNSSPLVLKAKEYLLAHESFDVKDTIYENWEVLSSPIF
ncbi:NUDIX hydrolase [Lacticaseibacillus pantheris]|uniref:NUDIX hydrolase n=1 Tax=Lacticaseibacillus pantheris TaxID=171523 RepID=UPI0007052730|nr:NUDIX hydrolase [Lacticaseibacillus pantheris]